MKKISRPERAYVLGIHTRRMTQYDSLESLDEAKSLVITAGAELIGEEYVELRHFSPSTFFGQGKVEELRDRICSMASNIPFFGILKQSVAPDLIRTSTTFLVTRRKSTRVQKS